MDRKLDDEHDGYTKNSLRSGRQLLKKWKLNYFNSKIKKFLAPIVPEL